MPLHKPTGPYDLRISVLILRFSSGVKSSSSKLCTSAAVLSHLLEKFFLVVRDEQRFARKPRIGAGERSIVTSCSRHVFLAFAGHKSVLDALWDFLPRTSISETRSARLVRSRPRFCQTHTNRLPPARLKEKSLKREEKSSNATERASTRSRSSMNSISRPRSLRSKGTT